MKKAVIAGVTIATVLALLGLAGYRVLNDGTATDAPPSTTLVAAEIHPASADYQGFLYGRITTVDGATYEGRLRWGGNEEAFWSDYFNGSKNGNTWATLVPEEQLPTKRESTKIFGVELFSVESPLDLGRPLMLRFGDLARIEAQDRIIRVILKSGTTIDLDRFASDDLADGVRVWDDKHGVQDFDEWRIRTIEFLPSPALGAAPYRLHGTVTTRQGEFTGFIQWNRELGVGTDELNGRTEEDWYSVRFDGIRSIERRSEDSCRVTLLDGQEVVLTGTREAGQDNRGMYVDDRRYGRVLISWDAFERVEFSSGNRSPAYDDFPPGRRLTGTVITRTGSRLTGRLVFDLDESETTETLDAPVQGVDYTIPFGLVASLASPSRDELGVELAGVTLHSGEELLLEPSGDFGKSNAGMLVFADGHDRPKYVPWSDVRQVVFDRPPENDPPHGH